MIQIDINGDRDSIDPGSIKELQDYIHSKVPDDQVVCVLRVNGNELPESSLEDLTISTIRLVSVKSDTTQALAVASLGDTGDWIERIAEVLDGIARDYRLGNEKDGAGRLVLVIDALQVLVGLLQGIHSSITLEEEHRNRLAIPWEDASIQLRTAIEGLAEDLESGDPIRIADRAGYAVPRSLNRFKELLGDLRP